MAEPSEASSSSPPPPPPPPKPLDNKPVVVRVKRKANQERLDAFWLEINERPVKRPFLDLEGLSISDSSGKVVEELRKKKLLVQHVETICSSEAVKDVLQSYLPYCGGSKDLKKKIEERRSMLKKDKKQEQLRSTARQKHEDLVRSARFEQIWKKRRERMEAGDDSLREICHLYDIVQVDTEDENSRKTQEPKHDPVEDNAILCNYLPLLREFIPTAAEEIESDMISYAFKDIEDGMKKGCHARTDYVYDLYTVKDGMDGNEDEAATAYPLVQVNEEDDYYDGFSDSDYGTDDSNAEDNPRNDYPDEESSGDEDEDVDPFDYFDGYDSEYKVEVADVAEEDDVDRRWVYR